MFGALCIKQRLGLTDAETIKQIVAQQNLPGAMEQQEHVRGLMLNRLSAAMGAEVTGFDRGMLNSPALGPALHRALLMHQLLLLRGLDLNAETFRRLSRRLGPIRPVPDSRQAEPGMPEVQRLSNLDADGIPSGVYPDPYSLYWHTDGSSTRIPSRFTLLYAVRIPNHGGETHFADMYAACAALTPAQRQALVGRFAIHDTDVARHVHHGRPIAPGGLTRRRRLAMRLRVVVGMLSPWTTRHPVICLHEETGRPCLLIGDSAWRITGYRWSTGARLIDELNAFATTNSQRTYTHRWRAGDLLIWDNRCLLHRGSKYDTSQPRVMLRAVVNGGLRVPVPADA